MRLAVALALLLLAGCVTPSASLRPASVPASCAPPCKVLLDEPGYDWEPHVAVDPRDARHVVAATRHLSAGSAPASFVLWFDVHVSRDGGRTWNLTPLRYTAALGDSTDPTAPNAVGDPVLAFLPDGSLLMTGATLKVIAVPGAGALLDVQLFATRSTDGGTTFAPPVVVERSRGVVFETAAGETAALLKMPDKPWLAVGPDGTVLLAWAHFLALGPEETGSRTDVVLATSRDAGQTWSAPILVARGGTLEGPAPAVGSDGAWYVGYVDQVANEAHVAVSRDRGATWRDAAVLPCAWMPSLAVARVGGHDRVYLASPVPLGSGATDAVAQAPTLVWSDDGGATWSAPLTLDKPDAPGRALPSVAADASGAAYVTWAHAVSSSASEMRAFVMQPDGARSSFTLDPAVGAPTTSLGDYLGLGTGASGAFAVWTTSPEGKMLGTAGAWVTPPG